MGYLEDMMGFVVPFLVGVVCVLLGRSNMRGNLSSLHAYHRSRVSEEDKMAFGKQVGLGTILVGVGIMVFSVLSAVTLYTGRDLFLQAGTVVLAASLVVGLGLSFHAMLKYNKGIF